MLDASRRARRVARRGRRGQALLRAGGRTHRRAARASGSLLHQAGRMAGRAGDPDSAAGCSRSRSSSTSRQGDTHAAARVLMEARAGSTALTGVATRQWREGTRLRRHVGRRARRGSRAARGASLVRLLVQRRSRARRRAGRAGAGHRRGAAYPEALALALRAKAGVAPSRGTHQGAAALFKQALEIALEHDLGTEAADLLLLALRPVLPA